MIFTIPNDLAKAEPYHLTIFQRQAMQLAEAAARDRERVIADAIKDRLSILSDSAEVVMHTHRLVCVRSRGVDTYYLDDKPLVRFDEPVVSTRRIGASTIVTLTQPRHKYAEGEPC
jgi:hypothetical protein